MASTVCRPASSSTSATTSFAPACAMSFAVSPPMPRAAPEISATLPSRRFMPGFPRPAGAVARFRRPAYGVARPTESRASAPLEVQPLVDRQASRWRRRQSSPSSAAPSAHPFPAADQPRLARQAAGLGRRCRCRWCRPQSAAGAGIHRHQHGQRMAGAAAVAQRLRPSPAAAAASGARRPRRELARVAASPAPRRNSVSAPASGASAGGDAAAGEALGHRQRSRRGRAAHPAPRIPASARPRRG